MSPDNGYLKVMSWNLWLDGRFVDDARPKQLAFLREQAPDVVGLQETMGEAARALATELGWHFHQGGSCGIISPHPITARYGDESLHGVGARVQLPSGRELVAWSAHLNYEPYGPYDFHLAGMSVPQVLAREEEAGRPRQIAGIIDAMRPALAERGLPVLLTGDFNVPSHLDWPELPWQVSVAVERAGLRDSYRVVHPDAAAKPGHTWSPLNHWHEQQEGVLEPQDRIDFVHYAGPLRPVASDTVGVGEPRLMPHHGDNEWTSDHWAVLSTFAMES
ncbi:endonuclease/exonuclease/phosphatase family protein [Catellatospora methionotrophica]|uniref:endonuclease/exonuclease/phosphatase family protein n=1 Tax=Catellatospora methionotrophica TaxID=121620 RepID=UPI0033CBA6A3